MARLNYERVGSQYENARGIPLDGLSAWREAVQPYIENGDRVLDLGAGTGVFARAFVQWFDSVHLLAIEPARAMREAFAQASLHPRIGLVAGDAEHIPLAESSCSAAWLSTVIHHVPDLEQCARELARVLRPGGHVLIRSAFPSRHEHITLFRYFPSAGKVADTFPTVERTTSSFAAAGFEMLSLASVEQVSAPSLSAFYERVKLRADTTLAAIPDDEFEKGVEMLRRDVAKAQDAAPIIDRLDLLVLRLGR